MRRDPIGKILLIFKRAHGQKCAAAFDILWHRMHDLLQELDPDFYREARLHLARIELEQLRRERAELADIERRCKIPLGSSRCG
jgi:hypothetical protein